MSKRVASKDERAEFEAAFREARPLKPIAPKALPKAALRSAKPSGINGGTARALDKGNREPEARLDLHGMTEAVAHRALATFLRGAQARGLRLVIVVTGKGAREAQERFTMGDGRRGVLKDAVPRWLAEPELARFIADRRAAHRRHGGEGALYVYLRKR